MRDLATELRNYVDGFDESFDPAALIEKAETVTVMSTPQRPSLRRRVLTGFAAAIIVLILVGGALLIGGLFSGDETPVVTQPTPETTVPIIGNRITVWTDGVDHTYQGPSIVDSGSLEVTFTRPSGPPGVPWLAVVGLTDGATMADFFAEFEAHGLGLEQLEGFLQPEAQSYWDWQPPAWMVYGNIVDPLGVSDTGSLESCTCTWDGLVAGEYHLFLADPRQPLDDSALTEIGTFEVLDPSGGG